MSDYLQAMFRRRPNDGWFKAGKYDATTTDIMCALAIMSMFIYGIGRSLFARLIFFGPSVRDFEFWRVVTWPIAEQPTFFGLLGVVFFWLFGQQIEALFGRNKFIVWVLSVAIIPAVVLTLLGALNGEFDATSADLGLGTMFLGGIWVYAATYPGVKWFEVVPLWALAGVFTRLAPPAVQRWTGPPVPCCFCLSRSLRHCSQAVRSEWPPAGLIPHIDLSGIGSTSSSPNTDQQVAWPET